MKSVTWLEHGDSMAEQKHVQQRGVAQSRWYRPAFYHHADVFFSDRMNPLKQIIALVRCQIIPLQRRLGNKSANRTVHGISACFMRCCFGD